MAKISKDLSAGTLHPRENIYASGQIAASNGEVQIPSDGCASFSVDLRGTFSATFAFEGTVDGLNWVAMPMRWINNAQVQFFVAASGTFVGVGACSGLKAVRVRCSSYSSGSAFVTVNGSIAPIDQSLAVVTPLIVSAVSAAGAALTLTLPAPSAGLRHYLTYLRIFRFASTTLTAGSAPVTINSTNIPGLLSYSCASDALSQGQLSAAVAEDYHFPLVASSPSNATTFICPATPGVIWRATAGYTLAP